MKVVIYASVYKFIFLNGCVHQKKLPFIVEVIETILFKLYYIYLTKSIILNVISF